MKKQILGFVSLTQAILLTAFLNLAGTIDLPAATNVVFDTETKLAPNGPRQLMFGIDVAINGSTAAVGALLPPFQANGGVYIYSLFGTNWAQTQILRAHTGDLELDSFGRSVALSSN